MANFLTLPETARTLRLSHVQVLQVVAYDPPPSLQTLAEQLNMKMPAMTRLTDGLAGRGYLDKHPALRNRRYTTVTITGAGRELLSHVGAA